MSDFNSAADCRAQSSGRASTERIKGCHLNQLWLALAVLFPSVLCPAAAFIPFSVHNVSYMVQLEPLPYQQAVASCAGTTLLRGALPGALLPAALVAELLAILSVRQPEVARAIEASLSGVGASSPPEQQQWSLWAWDEHRVCRAAKLLRDADASLVTTDRPCTWRLAYVCGEEQAAVLASGHTSSSDWHRRHFAPGAPTAPQPSPYLLGPGSGPGRSGLDLFRSGLVAGGDVTNLGWAANATRFSITVSFDDSERFWTHGPVVSALYRRSTGSKRLTALRLLREGEAADGWAMFMGQPSAINTSLVLGARQAPQVDGDPPYELYNVGPYHDYVVAVEGCFRATEVESLLLISRTGRRYQLGRGGCSTWFREDAPPSGYLAGVAGRYLAPALWRAVQSELTWAMVPDSDRPWLNQVQLVWAAPAGSSPPVAVWRPPPLLPPGAPAACPGALPQAFRIFDNLITACLTKVRACNSNTCCGTSIAQLVSYGIGYYKCTADATGCQRECAFHSGMCGTVPEASMLHFVVRRQQQQQQQQQDPESSAQGGPSLAAFVTNKNIQLQYDDAVQYCTDLSFMGMTWELITAQDSFDWLSSLETRRDAQVAVTRTGYFWLAPSSLGYAPAAAGRPDTDLLCLRGASGIPHGRDLFPQTLQASSSCSATATVVCRAVTPPGQDWGGSSNSGGASTAAWEPGLHLLSLSTRRSGNTGNGPYQNVASMPLCPIVLGAAGITATSGTAAPVLLDRPITAFGVSVAVQLGNDTDSVAVVSGLRVRLAGSTRGNESGLSSPTPSSEWQTAGAASSGGWHVLELAAGEVVVAVSGCAGGFLERLVLHTSAGRRWTHPLLAAAACSVAFTDAAPQPGGYLVGLQGFYGMYIEAAQMVWGQPLNARSPPPAALLSVSPGLQQPSMPLLPRPSSQQPGGVLGLMPTADEVHGDEPSALVPHSSNSSSSSSSWASSSTGAIVGGAVGSSAAAALGVAVLVAVLRRRRGSQQQQKRREALDAAPAAAATSSSKGALEAVFGIGTTGDWNAVCKGSSGSKLGSSGLGFDSTVTCVLDTAEDSTPAAAACRGNTATRHNVDVEWQGGSSMGEGKSGYTLRNTKGTAGVASKSSGLSTPPPGHAPDEGHHTYSGGSSSAVGCPATPAMAGVSHSRAHPRATLSSSLHTYKTNDLDAALGAYMHRANMSVLQSCQGTGTASDAAASVQAAGDTGDAAAAAVADDDASIMAAISSLHAELAGRHKQLVLTAVLGRGAFGVVYLGTWRGLQVAVKTLVVHDALLGREARQRHRAILEAAISKSLQHPNVVNTYEAEVVPLTVHASAINGQQQRERQETAACLKASAGGFEGALVCGVDAGDVYKLLIIQEYCSMGPLTAALGAGVVGSMAAGGAAALCAATLALDVACGMQHIHCRNIIHGDLSAGNILLSSCDRGGNSSRAEQHRGGVNDGPDDNPMLRQLAGMWRPPVMARVADFGLSVPMGTNQTHESNRFQGTPGYAAPEVRARGYLSRAADVWSFGVLLLELAHGLRIKHVRALCGGGPAATVLMSAAGAPNAGGGGHSSVVPSSHLPRPRPPWAAPPAGCPPRLAGLIEACLSSDPSARPRFDQVVECLAVILLEQHRGYQQQQQ